MQWGLSTGRTITYPISLLVLYSIVALDAASGMDAVQVCDVNTADNTNAIIFQMRLTQGDILPDNMTGFYWILIGRVQQWGDIVDGTNTFTVAFTSFCKIANAGSYSWGGDDNIIRSIELTYFTATYADNSYPFLYIAIGQQQWGTVDGTRGNFTTNLNVPYLSFYLPYASSTNTYGTSIWTVSARVETDLSKIGLSSEGNFEIIWLAVGM